MEKEHGVINMHLSISNETVRSPLPIVSWKRRGQAELPMTAAILNYFHQSAQGIQLR